MRVKENRCFSWEKQRLKVKCGCVLKVAGKHRPSTQCKEQEDATGHNTGGYHGYIEGLVFCVGLLPVHLADDLEVVVETGGCTHNHDEEQGGEPAVHGTAP